MDFFNKLGKKTTEAYQTAKEKTTKLSEELKLKGKISDCKEKIDNEYKAIGKIVYEKMKAGEDASKEEITPKCEEIERLKENIEKAEVELLALKNIKKCSDCGTELDLNADFCSICGAKQPKNTELTVTVTAEPAPEAKDVEAEKVETVPEVIELSSVPEESSENHEENMSDNDEDNSTENNEEPKNE